MHRGWQLTPGRRTAISGGSGAGDGVNRPPDGDIAHAIVPRIGTKQCTAGIGGRPPLEARASLAYGATVTGASLRTTTGDRSEISVVDQHAVDARVSA